MTKHLSDIEYDAREEAHHVLWRIYDELAEQDYDNWSRSQHVDDLNDYSFNECANRVADRIESFARDLREGSAQKGHLGDPDSAA